MAYKDILWPSTPPLSSSVIRDHFAIIYPHNNCARRSKEGAGQQFELLAFVNDVNQEATEGSDGIEHM